MPLIVRLYSTLISALFVQYFDKTYTYFNDSDAYVMK